MRKDVSNEYSKIYNIYYNVKIYYTWIIYVFNKEVCKKENIENCFIDKRLFTNYMDYNVYS